MACSEASRFRTASSSDLRRYSLMSWSSRSFCAMRERKGPSVGDVAVAVVELGDAKAAVGRVGGGGIGWEDDVEEELQKEGRMGLDNGESRVVVDDMVIGTAVRRLGANEHLPRLKDSMQ